MLKVVVADYFTEHFYDSKIMKGLISAVARAGLAPQVSQEST